MHSFFIPKHAGPACYRPGRHVSQKKVKTGRVHSFRLNRLRICNLFKNGKTGYGKICK
jgi:hypothetical protein